jgi:two-component system, cell cycle sensor histidine kinase and response regulator CckA
MVKPARILVVEDEAIVAADIVGILERLGYEVLPTADNAEKAVALARALRPDLVLMDIHLKGEGDGIKAARLVTGGLGIPLVYLTAHADTATLRRARHTEPYGYLVKPFDDRHLASAIEMALFRFEHERGDRERQELLATVVHHINDAVFCCDKDWHIVSMNPAAETMTGIAAAEALKRPLGEIVRFVTQSATEARAALAGRGDALATVDGGGHRLLITRDGGRVPVEETVVPLVNHARIIRGVVLVLKDISAVLRLGS